MNCPAWVDAKFRLHVLLWTAASALAYGLVAAIIPNPVFARQIAPEPFAIWVWLLSAPLMGIMGATYTSPWVTAAAPRNFVDGEAVAIALPGTPAAAAASRSASVVSAGGASAAEERSTWLGGVASLGAFLAIGCPVCNKIALLLLGASGALSVWAPIQPVLGAVSLALLIGTVAWRLRLRATGATCAV